MRLIFIVSCILLVSASSEIHQDFIDSSDGSQDEDKLGTASATHPYVGIPVGTWKITDMNSTEKEGVCMEQQAFCNTECGGQELTLSNFCNRSTMAWNCKCKNHVPDIPPYGWPSTLAECHGKENACNNGCSYGSTKAICLKACSQYYKCNQAGSPPSGLQVENEYNVPSYTGTHSPLNSSAQLLHVSSFQTVLTTFFITACILQIFQFLLLV